MEKPLVSVITITRNRCDLIGRCINSILTQTYTNIEHIVVDGASTDETAEVCRTFADKDSRFHYLRLDTNEPIPQTIMKGFAISKGDYVTFLDDDDEYLPTKIEKQLNKFSQLSSDYGMVYCWMTYYDSLTCSKIRDHSPRLRGNVYRETLKEPSLTGTPTYMIRRDVFEESGGWRERGIVSDWELAIRISKSWKVDYVEESLIKIYENHSGHRMSDPGYYSNVPDKYIVFYEYLLSEHKEFFDKNPQDRRFHLMNLSKMYLLKRDFKHFRTRYFELLRIEPSFRNLMIIPQYYLKSFKVK